MTIQDLGRVVEAVLQNAFLLLAVTHNRAPCSRSYLRQGVVLAPAR